MSTSPSEKAILTKQEWEDYFRGDFRERSKILADTVDALFEFKERVMCFNGGEHREEFGHIAKELGLE